MRLVIETAQGSLAGDRVDGVRRFLGVPYAQPPVGELRLASPRPPLPWAGTRPAHRFGPAAPQILAGSQTWLNDPIAVQDEDCLVLNVWSADGAEDAPVLVWFHGGATRNGHGGMAAIDGTFLARRHGLVVVTVNYRLGPLGGLGHPALTDPLTGYSANWGLQDKVAALRWVRDSIAAFGGDPDNVTIAGQSSGATDALLITQNPEFRSLFTRVIAQSPPLFQPPMLSDLQGAAEYTEALAGFLGTDIAGLRSIDGATLVAREQAFLRSSPLGRPRTAPTLDGQMIRDWPVAGVLPDVPLLIGFTRDEACFWYDLKLPDGTMLSALKPPADATSLAEEIGRLTARHYPYFSAPSAQEVVATYCSAMPDSGAAELFLAIYTDVVFRAPIVGCATRHAARGQPAYLYEFAWPLAAPAGTAPHAVKFPSCSAIPVIRTTRRRSVARRQPRRLPMPSPDAGRHSFAPAIPRAAGRTGAARRAARRKSRSSGPSMKRCVSAIWNVRPRCRCGPHSERCPAEPDSRQPRDDRAGLNRLCHKTVVRNAVSNMARPHAGSAHPATDR